MWDKVKYVLLAVGLGLKRTALESISVAVMLRAVCAFHSLNEDVDDS